jgi:hypothetical protein
MTDYEPQSSTRELVHMGQMVTHIFVVEGIHPAGGTPDDVVTAIAAAGYPARLDHPR